MPSNPAQGGDVSAPNRVSVPRALPSCIRMRRSDNAAMDLASFGIE